MQSPAGSRNIQRIAKKSQTSSSKIPMLDHKHITAVSIYPFLVNPFYQPPIYSSYIPLSYDATTHLLPVGQVPYQKEEYYHRIFGPLHTQFPIGYTNVPRFISSTLINNDPGIKKTINVLNPIPISNQEVIQKYDKELHTSEQISNQNQDDQNQMAGSHEIRDLQPPTTFNELNTSMPLDTINFSKIYPASTFPPLVTSNEPSKFKIYNNSVSELLLNSNDHAFITEKQILSNLSTTQEPFTFSKTEQLVTTVETYSSIISDKNEEDTLTSEKRSQPDEPRNAHHYSNDKYTTDILKPPVINFGEISTEMAKITRNPEISIAFSTLPTTTMTSPFSTPLSKNNGSKITTSSSVNSPRAETNINTKLYNVLVQSINDKSEQKSTKVSNEPDKIVDLISSSTRPSTTSITTSETSTLPYTKTFSIILTSSPPYPKYYSSTTLPYVKYITDKNDKIQSTSLHYTSLLPTMLQPLNTKKNTTSILLETKTEQIPVITLNSNRYTNNMKQNTNNLRHHSESTRSSSTPTIVVASHDTYNTGSPVKTIQNNLPSDINMYSNSQKIPTSTEKLNTYKDNNINAYFPGTTKGTEKSTLKSTVTPINQYNSVQKKILLDTVSDDSKFRKTTYNQDRYKTEISNTPKSIEDSELWYNHMYSQNPLQKKVNEDQIHILLKKIIKLLKPEIEKQTLTKESVARLVPPRLGDPEKFIYIIYPWVIDAAKNMENEERKEINANQSITSDKL